MLSVLFETEVLAAPDPLVPLLTVRQMTFAAAVVELAVARALARGRDPAAASWLILWVVTVFATYRLGLWAIGFRGHCGCLGHLFDWLPAFNAWADRITLASLCAMTAGSIWVLRRRSGVI